MSEKIYIAIDLKSFYASVECVMRGLDPMRTNLVVADASRTNKTICLAVSPSLKAYGISGRARLFEVVKKTEQINAGRQAALGGEFQGESVFPEELDKNPALRLSYIIAPPRMAYYIEYSTKIYNIYLKYVAPEDIHVYSVDEVFIDATAYLHTYRMSARELTEKMIKDVLDTTGITATAGIGTNLYLCKVAMDVMAKKIPADENGVRIAELDEMSYRRLLWTHRPLSDFWRVGRGYEKKLEAYGMFTMGDIARCSVGKSDDFYNEDLLYRLFGVNAELLIDHAWGWEPCTLADIKAYRPQSNSISSGQVLTCPYDFENTRIIVREMTDAIALELTDKKMVTDQLVLTVGYDVENLLDEERKKRYHGEITTDRYGRAVPKHAHGTANISSYTASSHALIEAAVQLFERITDKELLIRRLTICANHIIPEQQAQKKESYRQMDLFSDYNAKGEVTEATDEDSEKEKRLQQAMLDIKKKYGKNAVLRGTSFQEGATARDRNGQIGGHKA